MPTIRQTGINPQTEEKLAGTTKKKRPRQSPNNHQQQHSNNNNNPPLPEFIPIRTPSALLARDPHHLSSTLQVSLDSIHKLRSSVAECVVLDPYIGHGGYASEVISTVSKFCRGVSNDDNVHYHQEQEGENNSNNHSSSNEGNLRPQAIVVGAITALDLYAHSLLMKRIYTSSNSSSRYNNKNIGTGSISLDQLLLPDTTFNSFEDGSNLSLLFPFHIPTIDNNKFDEDYCYRNDNNTNDNSCPSNSSGGIPFGQITEFSGRTSSGKTQLALSIAVHAVVINNLQVKYLIAGGGGGSSRKAISRRLYTLCTALVKSQLMQQQRYQNHNNDGNRPVNFDKEVKSMALKCLDRISIATVHDAYSLLGSLVQIENEEKQVNSSATNNRGTLLVIDSISGCLGHHIYSDLTLGASLSNQVFLTLRRMTRSLDGNFFGGSNSSIEKDVSTTEITFQNPPRRFAVIVINGSVSKGVNDNNDGMMTSYSSSSSHKPAMGRYWQGGDIGLWLEPGEDDGQDDVYGPTSLFYEGNNNVAGLFRSSEKVVTATLMWHYGKSVGTTTSSSDVKQREESVVVEGQRHQVRFAIQAGEL